jgi:hypothetical protein
MMDVLALTIFVGLLLVTFFVILWIASVADSRQFNERDALLPLEPDAPFPLEHQSTSSRQPKK